MSADAEAPRDEIAEKARYWTSEVVNVRLSETFVGEARAVAAIVIAGLVGDDSADPVHSDEASCRLMLDAIKLSEGNLARLRLWVEAARMDPRDLIAAAEYPRELGEPNEATRIEDMEDYLAWLQGRA